MLFFSFLFYSNYSILFYSILFYSILFYSILFCYFVLLLSVCLRFVQIGICCVLCSFLSSSLCSCSDSSPDTKKHKASHEADDERECKRARAQDFALSGTALMGCIFIYLFFVVACARVFSKLTNRFFVFLLAGPSSKIKAPSECTQLEKNGKCVMLPPTADSLAVSVVKWLAEDVQPEWLKKAGEIADEVAEWAQFHDTEKNLTAGLSSLLQKQFREFCVTHQMSERNSGASRDISFVNVSWWQLTL